MTVATTGILTGDALAALTKDKLIEYAKLELGEELSTSDTKAALLEQINELQAELLREVPPVAGDEAIVPLAGVIGPQGALADAAERGDESPLARLQPKAPSAEDRIWVRIGADENDPHPVFVGCNGDEVLIPRESWQHVKRKHVYVLQTARQTVYRDNVASSVASYALTIDYGPTRPPEPVHAQHGLIQVGD